MLHLKIGAGNLVKKLFIDGNIFFFLKTHVIVKPNKFFASIRIEI